MSASISIDEALSQIASQRQLNNTDWKSISNEIPNKVKSILSQTYNADFNSKIVDPLNPTCNITIQSFCDKLMKHLITKFKVEPPFTIVRLSEILDDPKRYYNKPEKFLRAVENVLCVSSTANDFDEVYNGDGRQHQQQEEQENDNGITQNKVVPVRINNNNDPQTMLLTKIDWLTSDDIAEIESENYLAEAEYPLGDGYNENSYREDHEINEYEQQMMEASEENIKKRKVGDTNGNNVERNGKSDDELDSPEKRHKPDDNTIADDDKNTEDTSIADISVQDKSTDQIEKEETNEENHQFANITEQVRTYEKSTTTVTGLGPALELEDEGNTPKDETEGSEREGNDGLLIIRAEADPDVSLEEDKMDIDTTF